jgi:hypothetical protein
VVGDEWIIGASRTETDPASVFLDQHLGTDPPVVGT